MSRVTDTILTFGMEKDDGQLAVAAVNYVIEKPTGQGFALTSACVCEERVYGGGKHLQCNIAIAAFNYVSDALLVQAVRSWEWRSPEEVNVFVHREHDEYGFSILQWVPADGQIRRCPACRAGLSDDVRQCYSCEWEVP